MTLAGDVDVYLCRQPEVAVLRRQIARRGQCEVHVQLPPLHAEASHVVPFLVPLALRKSLQKA